MPRPNNPLKATGNKSPQRSPSGYSPEVQEKANAIALLFLDEAYELLKSKIKAGAFKKLSAVELMKEIRATLKTVQVNPAMMMQFNMPTAPQGNPEPSTEEIRRDRAIDAAVVDPEKRKALRESQQEHLEKNGPTGE